MSVFTIKSKVIANRDSTPPILTDPILAVGGEMDAYGTDQVPQTASAGSAVKLVQVPSGSRVSNVDYTAQSLGTSAIDIAVWYPTAVASQSSVVAGALISSSSFTANIAGVDAGIAFTDGYGLPSVVSLAKRSQPLWQFLGLAADPNCNLDMGFSVRTANSIAGYVGLRVKFVR